MKKKLPVLLLSLACMLCCAFGSSACDRAEGGNGDKSTIQTPGDQNGNRDEKQGSGLTSVTIGNSVTSIGMWAFDRCGRLTSLYYKGTAEDWQAIKIGTSNSKLKSATRYYYIKNEANVPKNDGNHYWHFIDGEIAVW